nr:MAG TPA: hypothetical protein [Caudoviricetes sp.]
MQKKKRWEVGVLYVFYINIIYKNIGIFLGDFINTYKSDV